MTTLRRALLPCVLLIALLISGCNKEPPPALPSGVQKVKGVLERTELSLVRRGTHALKQKGELLYYAESSTVNLGEYEGKEVEAQGVLEYNTDTESAPVLVVSAIQAESLRTWDIPRLMISLELPKSWQGKINGTVATFTASGSSTPFLIVFLEDSSRLSTITQTGSLSITQTTVGSRPAVRHVSSITKRERFQIDLRPEVTKKGEEILSLVFGPTSELMETEDWEERWEVMKRDVLRSVKLSIPSSSSSRAALPQTGSGSGTPCGGAAGILCPQGWFCQITDRASDSGRCQQIR